MTNIKERKNNKKPLKKKKKSKSLKKWKLVPNESEKLSERSSQQ
jgi:hypothetical protein